MDQVTYDQRYQQYNAQPQYWPYGYAPHVPHPHPDSTYTVQTVAEQTAGFPYNQQAQTARHMTSNEWMMVIPQNSQQAYAVAQNDHQYPQQMPTTVQTPGSGYAQHPQPAMHQGVAMSVQAPPSVVNYHSTGHTYHPYYQQDIQRGLISYQPISQPQHTKYAHTVFLPPASHYDTPRSIASADHSWQIPNSQNSGRHVEHYALAQPQPHHQVSEHAMSSPADRPQSNNCPRSINVLETPNEAPTFAPLSAQDEVKPIPNLQPEERRSHAGPNHAPSLPLELDSRSPSSISSSDSRGETPIRVSTLPQDGSPATLTKSSLKKVVVTALVKKEFSADKRVGRRKGPLKPEQRKQAGEIRKMKACLRCKFLKKTCDTGAPCTGCTPSHARLWQVPCTRIGIQEVGYFAKDFTTDTNRQYNFGNVTGESPIQVGLWVTHGFGYVLPVMARELYVKDKEEFGLEWTEGRHSKKPQNFKTLSASLRPIEGCISEHVMSEYVDKHIDGGFEHFVDNHFEGTKFITEMLKTVYSYYRNTKLPIVRKGLKLVVAYNLTMSITLAEGMPQDARWDGEVTDQESRKYGKTVAPLLVNWEVKSALAGLWRTLMNEVLMELATLYTSVYTGDKLKHWPTIFMLDTLLLAVWEEMQFDVCFAASKSEEQEAPERFCAQMEGIPVGVIVGLFLAISQKLPTFLEWDSKKHHHVLNSDMQLCDIMNEVKKHVTKHEDYLKKRPKECRFNPDDLDSFANKFVSRLVVRAN